MEQPVGLRVWLTFQTEGEGMIAQAGWRWGSGLLGFALGTLVLGLWSWDFGF
jgi:hypothetical protein